jgi:polyphosphate kinase
MPRNFFRRIEVAFPIQTPTLRDQIVNDVIPTFLNDRVKARELQPDGIYRRLQPEGAEPHRQAQWQFREVSRERTKKLTGSKKKARADKLIPISVVHPDLGAAATTSEEPFTP